MAAIDILNSNIADLKKAAEALIAAKTAASEAAIQGAADAVAGVTGEIVAATPAQS